MNANPTSVTDRAVRVIEPGATLALNLRDLWRHRALLYFFAVRDLKLRYRQTTLGVAWAVLQPLLSTAVLAVIWSRFTPSSSGVPYVALVFTAFVPWSWFSSSVTQASNSLVNNSGVITKVYFPREALPLASMLASSVDAIVLAPVLVAVLAAEGSRPSAGLLLLPAFIAVLAAATVGFCLLLAALVLRFRDVRHLVPFSMQLLFFASPVAYPSDIVPERWRSLYALNPLATVIDGVRWGALGTPAPTSATFAASALGALVLLVTGVVVFRRLERSFADFA